MDVAKIFAKIAACLQWKVGVVIAKDKRILAAGYNGPPKGIVHCLEVGCHKVNNRGRKLPAGSGRCYGAHAEVNAIVNAACQGTTIQGATFYCTIMPCLDCAKHIINAEAKEIVFLNDYESQEKKLTLELLRKAGVSVRKFSLTRR
jgi:dCMP deaminase